MALLFVNNGATRVDLGANATALRDHDAGTILVRAFPTTYPPASFRFMYDSNGGGTASRRFDIGGAGGTVGPRLIIQRDSGSGNMEASVLQANMTHTAVNTWCDWAVTWNLNGADADQHLYGGNLANAFTEVGTYNAQTAGSGTIDTEDPTINPMIGVAGNVLNRGFPGRIAWLLIWSRQLSLGELRAQQHRPHVTAGCVGFWMLWGTGTQPDLSGHLNNGTVTDATAAPHPPMAPPFGRTAGWRGAFTAAATGISIPVVYHHRQRNF